MYRMAIIMLSIHLSWSKKCITKTVLQEFTVWTLDFYLLHALTFHSAWMNHIMCRLYESHPGQEDSPRPPLHHLRLSRGLHVPADGVMGCSVLTGNIKLKGSEFISAGQVWYRWKNTMALFVYSLISNLNCLICKNKYSVAHIAEGEVNAASAHSPPLVIQ